MPNTYDLAGKLAIVTGGARRIGRAIVERFLASGAEVRIWDDDLVRIADADRPVVDISDASRIAAGLAELQGHASTSSSTTPAVSAARSLSIVTMPRTGAASCRST